MFQRFRYIWHLRTQPSRRRRLRRPRERQIVQARGASEPLLNIRNHQRRRLLLGHICHRPRGLAGKCVNEHEGRPELVQGDSYGENAVSVSSFKITAFSRILPALIIPHARSLLGQSAQLASEAALQDLNAESSG